MDLPRLLGLRVVLPSGRCEDVTLEGGSRISDLKIAAQQSLGQGFLRLIAPDGCMLDPRASVEDCGLRDGDVVSAVASEPRLGATYGAFALWCSGCGKVVTWGHRPSGGDSEKVQDLLENVEQIQATHRAFAAILTDGGVVAWGDAEYGGKCPPGDRLRNVRQIQATQFAFAAILSDERVVTWGDGQCGGDSSGVQNHLRTVQRICATHYSFAAILADGSVITWGHQPSGGDSSAVQSQLSNVRGIWATKRAFAAILLDGSVVTWGNPEYGGDSSEVQHELNNVQQLQATGRDFTNSGCWCGMCVCVLLAASNTFQKCGLGNWLLVD
eukprot:s390_g22.t1